MFDFQNAPSFGLDISTFSLKIAKLEKNGKNLRLVSFNQVKVPLGVIDEFKVKDEAKLASIIKEAIGKAKGAKIKERHVVASLPEEKSYLDVFRLPILEEKDLAGAVRFEAENHIPMALDDVYFGFEKLPIESEKQKFQEVLVVATPKEIVDSYISCLKMAGLQPVAMEVECLAVARALTQKNVIYKPLLMIDFGETRASFMIFSGRALRFTATIPVSSQSLTEALAKKLNVGLAKAEELKCQEGLYQDKEVTEAMSPILMNLAEQVKTHLQYYISQNSKTTKTAVKLSKILLCGGGANLKGLPEFLSANLGLPVELANPWLNILPQMARATEIPPIPFCQSLGFTTALGLALRSIYGD